MWFEVGGPPLPRTACPCLDWGFGSPCHLPRWPEAWLGPHAHLSTEASLEEAATVAPQVLRKHCLWGCEDITWDMGDTSARGITFMHAFLPTSGECFQNLLGPFQ